MRTRFIWVCACLGLVFLALATASPGDRFKISPDDLPSPNTTLPRDIDPQFVERPAGVLPKVPAAFSISIFASGPPLTHVRWMTVAPNGDIFLSEQRAGRITLLRDANGDGKADLVTTFLSGFSSPHGMAFHAGALYIADVRAIWRVPYHDGETIAQSKPVRVTVAPDLRPTGLHSAREIAFDSKGALYLTIGARKDLEDGDPLPDATVQLVAPDGTMTTFATGLRNTSALAFYPGTDDLWGTVNERDELGARLPPDFLARIGQGDFFGWPYAYTGPHPDPLFGAKRPDLVVKSKTPEVPLGSPLQRRWASRSMTNRNSPPSKQQGRRFRGLARLRSLRPAHRIQSCPCEIRQWETGRRL